MRKQVECRQYQTPPALVAPEDRRMIRRAIIPLLAVACAIAACESSDAPPQPDAQAAVASGGASSVEQGDAKRAAPALSPAIQEARNRAGHADMLALAGDVATLGDAQALAVAALLRDAALRGAGPQGAGAPAAQPKRMDEKVREWIDEAQRRAPDEITVLVFAFYVERDDVARKEALLARWRTLEPQNLVPVMYGTLPEAELFETALSASVYDSHYDDVLRLIIDTLSRASSPALARASAASPGMTRDEQAAAMALVFWASQGSPPFQRISAPCRAADLSVARRQACRHVAEILLRRSDVLIAEAIGGSIFKRGLGTATEKVEAEAYKRETQWLLGCMQQAYERDPRAFARRFVQLIRGGMHTTERMVMRQIVVEAGFPPGPPAGGPRDSR